MFKKSSTKINFTVIQYSDVDIVKTKRLLETCFNFTFPDPTVHRDRSSSQMVLSWSAVKLKDPDSFSDSLKKFNDLKPDNVSLYISEVENGKFRDSKTIDSRPKSREEVNHETLAKLISELIEESKKKQKRDTVYLILGIIASLGSTFLAYYLGKHY